MKHQMSLAMSRGLARRYQEAGRLDESVTQFEKVIALARVAGEGQPPYVFAIAQMICEQASILDQLERHADAERTLLAAWEDRGRIPVPTRNGAIMDMHILLFIEATAVNGVRVDAVIHGRASKRAPVKVFGVVFSDTRPEDEYPLPVLWVREGSSAWIGMDKSN